MRACLYVVQFSVSVLVSMYEIYVLRQTDRPRMNGSGGCNLQFLQSRSRQQKRRDFSGFFVTSAVLSAFVGCVSPIRLYGVPVSGMNAFVELIFVVCYFRGLRFFVVIEFCVLSSLLWLQCLGSSQPYLSLVHFLRILSSSSHLRLIVHLVTPACGIIAVLP